MADEPKEPEVAETPAAEPAPEPDPLPEIPVVVPEPEAKAPPAEPWSHSLENVIKLFTPKASGA